ncbi:hypothetical protein BH09VER1_BH09VER1_16990 [soil metagenome]
MARWQAKLRKPFVSYKGGESAAAYLSDGATAYAIQRAGQGEIHSFGFNYGSAYSSREHMPVPRIYKKDNHYPLSVNARTPVDKLLEGISEGRYRGLETIPFTKGRLLINHSPYTARVPAGLRYLSTFEGFDNVHLPAHHAVFVCGEDAAPDSL